MRRGIHWFRNDLRLRDNTALLALTERVDEWLPVFVLDPRIMGDGKAGGPRTRFLLDCVRRLGRDLEKRGVPLMLREGAPEEVLPELLRETRADLLSFNEDTTPYARRRDAAVKQIARERGCKVLERLDHVVFRSSEVRQESGKPYSVYTPYRNRWWKLWNDEPRLPQGPVRLRPALSGYAAERIPDPRELGLDADDCEIPTGGERAALRRLDGFLEAGAARYHLDRDRPDLDGTSRLSPYLRFGTISIRECFARAEEAANADPALQEGVGKWLDELVWREFYAAILEEHPRVLRRNFREKYDAVVWNEDPESFAAWCEGRTGYPIVDAGMRQLRATGWMHNRVRMIVASFLTKDLLIDWRKGERFFFERLVDGDPASNNGGWQWAASTGTDPQPYFRIFNPTLQGKRWDPDGRYVRRWIPELRDVPTKRIHAPSESDLSDVGYPLPIVNHAERRKLALERFRRAEQLGDRA